LGHAVQLSQDHDRQLRFPCKQFEPPCKAGNLFLTRRSSALHIDQLEIVNDNQGDCFFFLETANVGGDAGHALSGSVVDKQFGLRYSVASLEQSLYLLGIDMPFSEALA